MHSSRRGFCERIERNAPGRCSSLRRRPLPAKPPDTASDQLYMPVLMKLITAPANPATSKTAIGRMLIMNPISRFPGSAT